MEAAPYQPVSDSVFWRPPSLADLDAIHALESASYPEDEAATFEKLKFRIENGAVPACCCGAWQH
jgi:hypothetical protein